MRKAALAVAALSLVATAPMAAQSGFTFGVNGGVTLPIDRAAGEQHGFGEAGLSRSGRTDQRNGSGAGDKIMHVQLSFVPGLGRVRVAAKRLTRRGMGRVCLSEPLGKGNGRGGASVGRFTRSKRK